MDANSHNKEESPVICKVTAPLSIETIKAYFENKNQLFLIDYQNSQIKGAMLLTYISNLDLPCDIDLSGANVHDIKNLMASYFETKSIVSAEILHILAGKILLRSKNINSDFLFCGDVLKDQDMDDFIKINEALIFNWNSFVSSSFYFFLLCYKDLAEEHEIKNDFPEKNDPNAVGYNIVKLFSLPGFLEAYFAAPISHPVYYYKSQFEEYLFKGKNLYQYFFNPNNLLAVALDEVFQEKISIPTLNKAISNPTLQA